MKTQFYFLSFVCLSVTFTTTAKAQLISRDGIALQEQLRLEITDHLWPNHQSDPEIRELRTKYYSKLNSSLVKNEEETFFKIWHTLSEKQKRFYTSSFQPSNGQTPYHTAALARSTEKAVTGRITKELCKFQSPEYFVQTSLGYHLEGANTSELMKGTTPLLMALNQKNFEVARALIEDCGARVDDVEKATGQSSLMLAALSGNSDFFFYLIEKGADYRRKDLSRPFPRGVYFYYNLGRINKKHSSSSLKIATWLEENGFSFKDDALLRCEPFIKNDFVPSRKTEFVSFEESREDLRKKYQESFQVKRTSLLRAKLKLQAELKKQCAFYGYSSCKAINDSKLNKPVRVAAKDFEIAGKQGLLYFAVQEVVGIVVGVGSGRPEDCGL